MNAASEKFLAEAARLIGPYQKVLQVEAGLFMGPDKRAAGGRVGVVGGPWMELLRGRREEEIAGLVVSLLRVVSDLMNEVERDHGMRVKDRVVELFFKLLSGDAKDVSAGIRHDGTMRLDDRGRSHGETQAGD